jgi:hypothetical protein
MNETQMNNYLKEVHKGKQEELIQTLYLYFHFHFHYYFPGLNAELTFESINIIKNWPQVTYNAIENLNKQMIKLPHSDIPAKVHASMLDILTEWETTRAAVSAKYQLQSTYKELQTAREKLYVLKSQRQNFIERYPNFVPLTVTLLLAAAISIFFLGPTALAIAATALVSQAVLTGINLYTHQKPSEKLETEIKKQKSVAGEHSAKFAINSKNCQVELSSLTQSLLQPLQKISTPKESAEPAIGTAGTSVATFKHGTSQTASSISDARSDSTQSHTDDDSPPGSARKSSC